MRILEIIPQLSSGGGERFTVDLCNELSKHHKIRLIALYPLNTHGFYLKELNDNVEVVSFNKKNGLSLSLLYKIFQQIKTFQPDIVHTHLRGIMYLPLAIFFGNKKIKYFHTIHSDAEKEAGDRFSKLLRKLLFKIGKVIPITISEESLKSFIDFYHQKTFMIPNGRALPKELIVSNAVRKEIDSYKFTPSTKIIVNLARIMNVKRQPLIARVSKRLYEEGYDFVMLFIGRNENKEFGEELEQELGINTYILGERKNPLEYLQIADGYCLFSSFEGMPISLIEAMSMGAVPVCTPVGGIKNTIDDGVSGILAKDISETECYIALKRFLELNSDTLLTMRQNSIKTAESYSMEICAKKYINLFREDNTHQSL